MKDNISIETLRSIIHSYNRFVPQTFIKILGRENINDILLGDQVEKELTVFFSDIRCYSSLSESMPVSENFKFLNAYLDRVVPAIEKHDGLVHQFLGDGIMALFLNKPENAIDAAITYQKVVSQYNLQRVKRGRKTLQVGIGLHTGKLILGIIGNETRMSFGVVSDAVNLASRLEGLTKYFGASVLVSENSFNKLTDPSAYLYRYLGEVQIKGKKNVISIYEFFDGDTTKSIMLKTKSKAYFEAGIRNYYTKNYKKAIIFLNKVLRINSQDVTAWLYRKKAASLLLGGAEEDNPEIEHMIVKI